MFFWNSCHAALSYKSESHEDTPRARVARRHHRPDRHHEEAEQAMSTRRILTAIVSGAIIVASSASVAWAQTAKPPVTERTTVYDFELDDVTGEIIKPLEDRIGPESRSKSASLIQVRKDFVPEIMESVGEI